MTIEPIPKGARMHGHEWNWKTRIVCPACKKRKIKCGTVWVPDGIIIHQTWVCPRCGGLEYVVETGIWKYSGGPPGTPSAKREGEVIE